MSIKVITIMKRPSTDIDFFFGQYREHPIMEQMRLRALEHDGFVGAKIEVSEDRLTGTATLEFSNDNDLRDFVNTNEELMIQRGMLMDEWCTQNNCQFDVYIG
jgi:hypothetical protein